jgi:hypothetical protein
MNLKQCLGLKCLSSIFLFDVLRCKDLELSKIIPFRFPNMKSNYKLDRSLWILHKQGKLILFDSDRRVEYLS